jgi:hypothetical protein
LSPYISCEACIFYEEREHLRAFAVVKDKNGEDPEFSAF